MTLIVAGASTSCVSVLVAETTTVSVSDAIFSVSFGTMTVALPPTTTLPAVAGAKPTIVAVTSYVPTATFKNVYAPLTAVVATVRPEGPVSWTVAPGTAAPCSSTTVPVTCAVCARADAATVKTRQTAANQRSIHPSNKKCGKAAHCNMWLMTSFRRVAVLGAGTMGAQIAAHFTNAGVPVLLLDVTADAARDGLKRARGLKPDPFFTADGVQLITTGGFDTDLDKLKDVDWILEAVIEQLDAKRALLERLETVRRPGTIVSSNTSGIPIRSIADGRTAEFRQHWIGTHFFNP